MELIKLQIKLINFINDIDKKYKIKFAYLFGSRARGDNTDNSDIDIAIFFKDEYDSLQEILIRGNIIEDGKAYLGIPVDVISLKSAPLILKHQIIKDGIILKDDDDRPSFESLTFREYFDFKYYSDIYDAAIINSIKAGEYFRR
jgi:predicted nucleotidyltransferase